MSGVRGLACLAVLGLGLAAGAAGCDEKSPVREPITIGLIAPKTGALGFVGASFERVATAAVAEINSRGGVNGHPLVLVVVDDETDATKDVGLLDLLIDTHGAVAVVGPATSGAVTSVVARVKERHIPIISPSSTAQALESADDGGYMFRNVPNDGFQGLAMAYYLTERATPAITGVAPQKVVIVHEDSPYGAGLAGQFEKAFTDAGGVTGEPLTYAQNLTEGAATDAIVAQIVAEAPTMVVLIALEQDGLKIVNGWDQDGSLPDMQWFFTDGARSAGFLTGLPESIVGSLGTAPTNPITGDAYAVMAKRYNASNDDDIGEQVFAANVWDAVFLIAAALAQQEHDHPGEPFGGEHLRDAITSVSKEPGQIIHAGQWRDLMASIRAGGDVDYDGASGPCDFGDNGEAIGPYEVWRISGAGAAKTFEQELFLEAGDLFGLTQP